MDQETPERSYGIGEWVVVPGITASNGLPVMGTVVAVIPDPSQVCLAVERFGEIEKLKAVPKRDLDFANSAELREAAAASCAIVEPLKEGKGS